MISLKVATTCNLIRALKENPSFVGISGTLITAGIVVNRRKYHQHGFSRKYLQDQAEKQKILQHQKDCRALNLPEDCTDESQARDAFIKLAKKYHPDGRMPEASAEKFQEIDTAYKNLLKEFADSRHNSHKIEGEYGVYYQEKTEEPEAEKRQEEESPDIKHTAPQHRQYLSYDGVGSGNPFQREKQYKKYRTAKAAENIMDYRVQQASKSSGEEVWALAKEARASKKTKTGLGVDRLVEDLIQESMARGDFDNLSGKGKPLKHDSSYNPYIDFTTHKLNQVLIDNGFAPEWIMLEKEIKDEIRRIRKELSFMRHKYDEILSPGEESEWKKVSDELAIDCDTLNKMILKFNLTVPSLHKQMMSFQLDREAKKALSTFSPEMKQTYSKEALKRAEESAMHAHKTKMVNDNDSFMGMFLAIFKT